LWIALSIAVGAFAHVRRGRNGLGWFVLALIVSPLVAGVFCAILREKDQWPTAGIDPGAFKTLPLIALVAFAIVVTAKLAGVF
jgi:hypothetical protein